MGRARGRGGAAGREAPWGRRGRGRGRAVSATTSRTPCAVAAGSTRTTSRSPPALRRVPFGAQEDLQLGHEGHPPEDYGHWPYAVPAHAAPPVQERFPGGHPGGQGVRVKRFHVASAVGPAHLK